MADINNPNTPISYINKDFQTLYIELLDTVKKLTYKWDPSISNESDPGVILLKLDALIADKLNYNLDMNILETSPNTVSQESNSYNLFEQLGYLPDWYISANSANSVVLKWNTGKEVADDNLIPAGETRTVPKFTMICDAEKNYVYTILNDVIFTKDLQENIVKVIQGVITPLEINGDTLITLTNLDSQNRIYLPKYNIAQNGIFISNIDSEENTKFNFDDWTCKDNLYIEALGNKVYKFGIDQTQDLPYIEFPEDIDLLIDEGLRIFYIQTDGFEGNISANMLTDFYSESKYSETNSVITTGDITISNTSAIMNGKNPESISDSYKGYKKVSGTFETLVTLRDYINAINRSGYVSNCFVCDRTNDIQCSYTVVSEKADLIVDKVIIENNSMTAFDLKIYALENIDNINSISAYNRTFDMVSPDNFVGNSLIQGSISAKKCIQHDYQQILADKFCLFRNKYPLNIKIIPYTRLSDKQRQDITLTIVETLMQALNAGQVDFGSESAYDTVYNLISNCDNRIKAVVLDDFSYTTYAVYWNGEAFNEIPINGEAGHAEMDSYTQFRLLTAQPEDWNDNLVDYYKRDDKGNYSISIEASNKYNSGYTFYSLSGTNEYVKGQTYRADASGYVKYTPTTGTELEDSAVYYKAEKLTSKPADLAENYFSYAVAKITTPAVDYPDILESVEVSQPTWKANTYYTPRILSYRKEIFAKSVLAGKTPIINKDEKFNYSLIERSDSNILDDIVILGTGLRKKVFNATVASESNIKLGANQNIVLYSNAFKEIASYSTYIKYELYLNSDDIFIPANTPYKLGQRDYITFFYKKSDSDEKYTAVAYGEGTILKPNFKMNVSPTTQTGTMYPSTLGQHSITLGVFGQTSTFSSTPTERVVSSELLNNVIYILGVGSDRKGYFNTVYGEGTDVAALRAIFKTWSDQILDGTRNVDILEEDKTTFTYDSGRYCYWITGIKSLDGKQSIIQLNSNGEYVLQEGEIFCVTDNKQKNIDILEAGYKLKFIGKDYANNKLICSNPVSEVDIANYGVNKLVETNSLIRLNNILKNQGDTLEVINSDIYTIPENSDVMFTRESDKQIVFSDDEEASKYMELLTAEDAPNGWSSNYTAYYTRTVANDGAVVYKVNEDNNYAANKYYNFKYYILSKTVTNTDDIIVPEGIRISYKTSDNTTYSELPNLIEPYTWRLFGRYNIETDNDIAQIQNISDLTKLNSDGSIANIDTVYYISFTNNKSNSFYYIPGFTQNTTVKCKVDGVNIVIEPTDFSGYALNLRTLEFDTYSNISKTTSDVENNYIIFFNRTDSNNIQNIKSVQSISILGDPKISIGISVDEKEENMQGLDFKVYSDSSILNTTDSDIKFIDNNIEIGFTSLGSKTLDVGLPTGTYLIPIKCVNNSAIFNFTLKYQDNTESPLYLISDSSVDIKLNNYNYKGFLLLDLQSNLTPKNLTVTLKLGNPSETERTTLIIEPLVKFIQDTNYNEYISTVKELDVEHIYDYAIDIDEDVIIKDPLSGLSFFNYNHIYNKFTIPFAQIDTGNISITNQVKGVM